MSIRRILLLALLCTAGAVAQPAASIHRVRALSDRIHQMDLAVTCGGTPYYALTVGELTIQHDVAWLAPGTYTIDQRPAPDRNACYNVALVLDRSSAMLGSHYTAMLAGAMEFVDSMKSGCQATALISYGSALDIHEFLTHDATHLRTTLATLALTGGQRVHSVFDGITTGITEIESHGTEPLRVIVAVTAGRDAISTPGLDALVTTAREYNYRIFIIGIGTQPDPAALAKLATASGGWYIAAPDSASIPAIFRSLSSAIRREFDEYRIIYTAPWSFTPRQVRAVVTACGGTSESVYIFTDDPTRADPDAALPTDASIDAVHPHPVDGRIGATLRFTLGGTAPQWATLTVTDVMGRTVAVLADGLLAGGSHSVSLTPSSLPAGVAFLRLRTERGIVTRMMLITR